MDENITPYRDLENLLKLTEAMRKYGASREDILYVIACYGSGISLPGFDDLKELYRSRLSQLYGQK